MKKRIIVLISVVAVLLLFLVLVLISLSSKLNILTFHTHENKELPSFSYSYYVKFNDLANDNIIFELQLESQKLKSAYLNVFDYTSIMEITLCNDKLSAEIQKGNIKHDEFTDCDERLSENSFIVLQDSKLADSFLDEQKENIVYANSVEKLGYVFSVFYPSRGSKALIYIYERTTGKSAYLCEVQLGENYVFSHESILSLKRFSLD